ncbi:MAG TPA: DUF4350 domain-containing protein [Candidatus Eisenbacteria bacterium]
MRTAPVPIRPLAARSVVLAALLVAAPAVPARAQQIPDTTFADTVRVAHPAFASEHPRVLIDEGHHNVHTMTTGYAPFAALLRADGYDPEPLRGKITPEALAGARLLVVVNALGAADPSSPQAPNPAFDEAEGAAAAAWVKGGGSLLLIADHYPCGSAAEPLARAFDVTLTGGIVGDTLHYDRGGDPTCVEYTPVAGLATSHPIIRGRDPSERVERVVTFTGESLQGPRESTSLLLLGADALDLWPPDFQRTTPAGGKAQAVALTPGKGRVVVLGEAAMMTAQLAGPDRVPVGLNRHDNDDRKFALNVVHWLTGVLP